MSELTREHYQIRLNHHKAIAGLNYYLECFGDHLAKENGYPSDIYGFDAVYLYLCNKHSWTISQCRSMEKEDIRLALSQETKGWILPRAARFGTQDQDDFEVVIERT